MFFKIIGCVFLMSFIVSSTPERRRPLLPIGAELEQEANRVSQEEARELRANCEVYCSQMKRVALSPQDRATCTEQLLERLKGMSESPLLQQRMAALALEFVPQEPMPMLPAAQSSPPRASQMAPASILKVSPQSEQASNAVYYIPAVDDEGAYPAGKIDLKSQIIEELDLRSQLLETGWDTHLRRHSSLYIGKTTQEIAQRARQHQRDARLHPHRRLQKTLNDGVSRPMRAVIVGIRQEQLAAIESYMIRTYGANSGLGLNSNAGKENAPFNPLASLRQRLFQQEAEPS